RTTRLTRLPYTTLFRSVAIAVGNDRQFAALARELGQPELADDPRFSSNSARVAHRQDLKAIIEAATAQDTAVHWAQTLMSAGVPDRKSTRLNSSHVKIS